MDFDKKAAKIFDRHPYPQSLLNILEIVKGPLTKPSPLTTDELTKVLSDISTELTTKERYFKGAVPGEEIPILIACAVGQRKFVRGQIADTVIQARASFLILESFTEKNIETYIQESKTEHYVYVLEPLGFSLPSAHADGKSVSIYPAALRPTIQALLGINVDSADPQN